MASHRSLRVILLALSLLFGCHRQPQRWEIRSVKGGYVARYSFEAMDTIYTITVAGTGKPDESLLARTFAESERIVRDVEARMSYFRPSSDLGRLNRSKGAWVSMSPDTVEVLHSAMRISRLTMGAFDPTWAVLKPLYRLKDESWQPPTEQDVRKALEHVGISRVNIDGTRVRLTDPEARVDLGGIAKGYAVGKAYNYLKSLSFSGFIVEGGGDLCLEGQRPDREWMTGIRSPRGNGLMAVMPMRTGCVFTSGDYERYRMVHGKRYTHIVDPRTGHTVDHNVSATVIGPDPVVCDGLATALMVLLPSRAATVLKSFPGYEAMVVERSGIVHATPRLLKTVKPTIKFKGFREVRPF